MSDKTYYEITVNHDQVAEAVSLFEFVGGNTSTAIRIAINKTTPIVKTAVSRAIRDQVRLTASYVGGAITIKKATTARLSGAIGTPIRGLLLSRFSTNTLVAGDKVSWIKPPAIPTMGIKVKVKPDGITKSAPRIGTNKPFYMVLNGGQNIAIAAREGPGRGPVHVFHGPSISQVFDTVRADLLPKASAVYQDQLIDAMRYLLLKQYPPEAA